MLGKISAEPKDEGGNEHNRGVGHSKEETRIHSSLHTHRKGRRSCLSILPMKVRLQCQCADCSDICESLNEDCADIVRGIVRPAFPDGRHCFEAFRDRKEHRTSSKANHGDFPACNE